MLFAKTLTTSAILALAHGATLSKRAALSGEATYYGGNVAGGACSFSTYTLPSSIYGTALSDSNWDTSANCGRCVSVTGPSGNSITAMIVDECPGCGTNHLDLFPTAFTSLAEASKGVIDISWNYVDCPISSALEVHNKEGVSAYWFSMQVVNANKGVSTLEVSTDGGNTWQSTTRTDYNYFEQTSGFGTTTVDVKITSVDGDVVIVKSVTVSSGASTTASANFGSSSPAATVAEKVASSSAVAVVESTPAPTASSAVQFKELAATSYAAVGMSTDSTTTSSSTTTLTRTITIKKSTSTPVPTTSTISIPSSTSVAPTSSQNASTSLADGASISVVTITICKPTVLTSVFPVSSTSSALDTLTIVPIASPSATYSANVTVPLATATPAVTFTGSASTLSITSTLLISTIAVILLI